MNTNPNYTNNGKAPIKTIEPDASTPEGLLLAAAEALHGAPHEMTSAGRAISRALIGGMIGAASAAGYSQADLLATMLSNCEITPRTVTMAREACAAAGDVALRKLYDNIGLVDNMTGGAQ